MWFGVQKKIGGNKGAGMLTKKTGHPLGTASNGTTGSRKENKGAIRPG